MRPSHLTRLANPIMLVALFAVGGAFAGDGPVTPDSAAGTPATQAQRQEFVVLIQRYRRVFFDGWVAGDLSAFPTVFYNDPVEDLSPHLREMIRVHRATVDAVLARATSGPVGARDGLLAAEMGEVLERRASDAEWQAAEAAAGAQGRTATLADVASGQPPIMTPRPSDWIEKQIFITGARVRGDRASVTYVVDRGSSLFFHLHLKQVGGQWYLTNGWVTGNP